MSSISHHRNFQAFVHQSSTHNRVRVNFVVLHDYGWECPLQCPKLKFHRKNSSHFDILHISFECFNYSSIEQRYRRPRLQRLGSIQPQQVSGNYIVKLCVHVHVIREPIDKFSASFDWSCSSSRVRLVLGCDRNLTLAGYRVGKLGFVTGSKLYFTATWS